MKELDISDLHLVNWTETDENGKIIAGGSPQTEEAIERIVDKINELILKK